MDTKLISSQYSTMLTSIFITGIAIRALQLVDQRLLEQWANADMNAMNTISKLWEKIQRCDVKPAIQREALCFYAVVGGPSKLSPAVVEAYEAALVNIKGWTGMETQKSLSCSLPLFAVRVSYSFMPKAFLSLTLDRII